MTSSWDMVTTLHGNAFLIIGFLWGNPCCGSPPTGPVMRSFDVIFAEYHLLNKQSCFLWFEVSWRSCGVIIMVIICVITELCLDRRWKTVLSAAYAAFTAGDRHSTGSGQWPYGLCKYRGEQCKYVGFYIYIYINHTCVYVVWVTGQITS